METKQNSQTVMLIDDDNILRKMLKKELSKENLTIVEAKNGLEALDALKTVKPNLIVLDFVMPKMGGLEFIKKLRQNKNLIATPVILLTQIEYDEKIAEVMKMGACSFLVKSKWELSDVVKKIKEKLVLR